MKYIRSVASFKKLLGDLRKEEVVFDVPEKPDFEFLQIMDEVGMRIERRGFKRYFVSRKKLKAGRALMLMRVAGLVSLIMWVVFLTYFVLFPFWAELESTFVSLPITAGLLSGIIIACLLAIVSNISKTSLKGLILSYLDV